MGGACVECMCDGGAGVECVYGGACVEYMCMEGACVECMCVCMSGCIDKRKEHEL